MCLLSPSIYQLNAQEQIPTFSVIIKLVNVYEDGLACFLLQLLAYIKSKYNNKILAYIFLLDLNILWA